MADPAHGEAETEGGEQEPPVPPAAGEEMTVASDTPGAAGDRALRENVDTLNRWLASIKKLRRV